MPLDELQEAVRRLADYYTLEEGIDLKTNLANNRSWLLGRNQQDWFLGSEWSRVRRVLSRGDEYDLIGGVDRAWQAWEPSKPPLELRCFLLACRAVQVDPAEGSLADWQLTPPDVDEIWQDCLAVCHYRLRRALAAAGLAGAVDPRAAPANVAGVDGFLKDEELLLLAQLETDWAATAAAPAPRPAYRRLLNAANKDWLREVRALLSNGFPGPAEAAAELLAVSLVAAAEEQIGLLQPLLVLTAGSHKGVAQLDVVTLPAHDQAGTRIELALWSRHRTKRGLTRLEKRLPLIDEFIGISSPGPRYRIALNPPGVAPARQGHIGLAPITGESIDFPLAVAAYAAANHSALGRYALTGKFADGPDGDPLAIEAVAQVKDKLEQLGLYNEQNREEAVYDVLVPTANFRQMQWLAIQEMAERYGLTLNGALPAGQTVAHLRDVLQPGILFDGLEEYVGQLLLSYAARRRWQPDNRSRANELLAALSAPQTQNPSGRAFIIPAPGAAAVDELIGYLALRLAWRRRQWCRMLARIGMRRARLLKPPAPLVFDADRALAADLDFLKAAVEAARPFGGDKAAEYVCYGWEKLPGDLVLLLKGPNDLVSTLITPPGGLLAQLGAARARPARQSIVLVAESYEQMQHWTADLVARSQKMNFVLRPGGSGVRKEVVNSKGR